MSDIEDPIIVVSYNADWSIQYEQEKIRILNAVGDAIAEIQHIGSTAVPGLAAKPVIDILLGLKQIPPSPIQIGNLEALSYLYCGELGIPNRHYFRRGMPRTYQIHAVQIDSEFRRSHILFRDFLIAHP
ncbi:GrpB family protein, partial [Chroococcidiopsidales cyanobacterium LEGE 13417]|nr:GrpB family protein [Chroococcidiopsidales cyanobacterium LEGE 13417]